MKRKYKYNIGDSVATEQLLGNCNSISEGIIIEKRNGYYRIFLPIQDKIVARYEQEFDVLEQSESLDEEDSCYNNM